MKDIRVLITNVTEQRMAVIPVKGRLQNHHLEYKKNCETQALFELCKIGYTLIKFEWRQLYMDSEGLYVTFGKLIL